MRSLPSLGADFVAAALACAADVDDVDDVDDGAGDGAAGAAIPLRVSVGLPLTADLTADLATDLPADLAAGLANPSPVALLRGADFDTNLEPERELGFPAGLGVPHTASSPASACLRPRLGLSPLRAAEGEFASERRGEDERGGFEKLGMGIQIQQNSVNPTLQTWDQKVRQRMPPICFNLF